MYLMTILNYVLIRHIIRQSSNGRDLIRRLVCLKTNFKSTDDDIQTDIQNYMYMLDDHACISGIFDIYKKCILIFNVYTCE